MTLQAVTSCKYLRACLNEGMRLYPPTPGSLPRLVPGKGEMIEGKWVPGGYAVGVNQLAAGHSERNFKKAEFHDPENDWWNQQGTYLVWEKLPLQVKLTPVSDLGE